jgi:hypothetical protein
MCMSGPEGEFLKVAAGPDHIPRVGKPVYLCAYPEAPRRDVPELTNPTFSGGHIVNVTPSLETIIADYQGGK